MEKTHFLSIKNRVNYITLSQATAIFWAINRSMTDMVEIRNDLELSYTKKYKREIILRPLDEKEKIIYNQDDQTQARLLLFISDREEKKLPITAEILQNFLDTIN